MDYLFHLLCDNCGSYPCVCDELIEAEKELELAHKQQEEERCPICGKPEELWNECECNEPEDFGTRIVPNF
jgi:hypothetical protein